MPLTLRQRGYDGARIEYVGAANQNATKYASDVNQVNREIGNRMPRLQCSKVEKQPVQITQQRDRGHRTAQGLNDQTTNFEFTGRLTGAEITQKASIESAKLQAISTIISRMGAKIAQHIEKGMEMRY